MTDTNPPATDRPAPPAPSPRVWLAAGVALAAGSAALAWFLWQYVNWPRQPLPRLAFTALYGLLGVCFLAAVWASRRMTMTAGRWAALLAVAVAMRAAMWHTPWLRNEDYHRYLWDGAVTAHGANPYRHSPQSVLRGEVDDPRIRVLARPGRTELYYANHGHLRTIYPPLAQGLFAVAHWLAPFRPAGLGVVFGLADVLTAVGVWLLLRRGGLPLAWLTAYLWNPLIPVEVYYCLHYDVALCLPLLLLAWALVRGRPAVAGAALAAAVALKVWPVVLVGLVAGRFRRAPGRLLAAGGVFVVLTGAALVPFAVAMPGAGSSGAVQYATHWEVNAFAYWLVHWLGWGLWRLAGQSGEYGNLVGRALLMLGLLAAGLRLGWRVRWDRAGEARSCIAGMTVLMLLAGPTIYPWYALPTVALAAVVPRAAYVAWFVALMLMNVPEMPGRWAVLAALHVPVWFLLVRTWRRPHAMQAEGGRADV